MRVSWNWLKDYVDVDGLTPEEVAERLTMSGMEVEGVETIGSDLDGVVVGRVLACESHPGADKLSVCTVDVGASEPLSIVCGAPNAATGIVAPVALVGATLGGTFKIKRTKIRGVESLGMLCSASELDLDEDAFGLLLLDPTADPGTPIADVLGLRDVVFDIGLTPNRADGLSIRGVAREVAALFGRNFVDPPGVTIADLATPGAPDVADIVSIDIDDAEGCPRYAGAVVRGLRIGPAPGWMQQRLRAVGQRPVNNIVDVTNYVLFEQGQPLHAFDLQRVRGGRIVVRRAHDGETMESIDHVERALLPGDLMICDAVGPVAIGGVMGGAESEIADDTTDVLIECANFEPASIRRTSKRLGMHTESSHRFERGVDVERIPLVMHRTIELLVATQEHLGATCEVLPGIVDTVAKPYVREVIRLPIGMPERILGQAPPRDEMIAALERLGLEVASEPEALVVTVPAFRPDLERPIDLVEEIGRLAGFDRLPAADLHGALGLIHRPRTDAPVDQPSQPIRSEAELDAWDSLRDAAAEAGLFEAVTWAMVDPERTRAIVGDTEAIRLRNPLGEERSVLRRTLLVGLLDGVAYNLTRGADRVALFELGRVYPPVQPTIENVEPVRLAAVVTGSAGTGWTADARDVDVHDLVGMLDSVCVAIGASLSVQSGEAPRWSHPGISGVVELDGTPVGWIGALHPSVLDVWEIEQPVFGLEIEIGGVLEREPVVQEYRQISRTQSSVRDLAILVDAGLPWRDVDDALVGFEHKYLESLDLFDVYQGRGVEDGSRSLAIRATYRNPKDSLTDKQVDKAQASLLRHLEARVGARIR